MFSTLSIPFLNESLEYFFNTSIGIPFRRNSYSSIPIDSRYFLKLSRVSVFLTVLPFALAIAIYKSRRTVAIGLKPCSPNTLSLAFCLFINSVIIG